MTINTKIVLLPIIKELAGLSLAPHQEQEESPGNIEHSAS